MWDVRQIDNNKVSEFTLVIVKQSEKKLDERGYQGLADELYHFINSEYELRRTAINNRLGMDGFTRENIQEIWDEYQDAIRQKAWNLLSEP